MFLLCGLCVATGQVLVGTALVASAAIGIYLFVKSRVKTAQPITQ